MIIHEIEYSENSNRPHISQNYIAHKHLLHFVAYLKDLCNPAIQEGVLCKSLPDYSVYYIRNYSSLSVMVGDS